MLVATGGCFSFGVHPGHLWILKKCREFAGSSGKVHVYVNCDEWIKKNKGKDRLIYNYGERCELLLGTRYVDEVIQFPQDNPSEMIRHYKPALWVKNCCYEEMPEQKVVESYGGGVVVLKSPIELSTTTILERIRAWK